MFFGYNVFATWSHKMLKTTLHMLRCKGFGLEILAHFMRGLSSAHGAPMHKLYKKF